MPRKILRLGFSFILCLVTVSLISASPLLAQKAQKKTRVPDKSIPANWSQYSTPGAALRAHSTHNLKSAATLVATSERVRLESSSFSMQTLTSGLLKQGLGAQGGYRLQRAENGTVSWMEGKLGSTSPLRGVGKRALEEHAREVVDVLQEYTSVLGLENPGGELRSMQTSPDELGFVHARFEQVYDSLPVWGRDLYVHTDATGAIFAINGTYEPTPRNVLTTPVLRESAALQTVISDLKSEQRWAPLDEDAAEWMGFGEPESQLVLYPDADKGVTLAYEVSLHPNFLEWYTYLIDAADGSILNRIERHCTFFAEEETSAPARLARWQGPEIDLADSGAPGYFRGSFGSTTTSDLNGRSTSIRTYLHDNGRYYMIWDLPNMSMSKSQFPDKPSGGALTLSANSTDFGKDVHLTHRTSSSNSWSDRSSVSAHVNMRIAYDYYKSTHNRNAIDGKDLSLISVVDVTSEGQQMDNAFWNGRVMAYGNGKTYFKPLAGGLDVAAHEMSHGVIQNTADLLYQFQSGALNESFADVFGVMVDSGDMLLGEDIMQAGRGLALRDLLNPGNPQVLSKQPAHMSEFNDYEATRDNGGVHSNSGIPNRAAGLILQNLGQSKTERIYYRALSNYLTRNSQFGDALNALEQSAQDLYGSTEVNAVRQAYAAVGISNTSGTDSNAGNDVPAQTGGESFIAFMLEDGKIGYIDMSDPNDINAFTFSDAAAVARVHVARGDRSQLTTTLTGEDIWFVNQDLKLAYLTISNGEVSVFDNLYLRQMGDLWNASISPDGNHVALVSSYLEDPVLYIFDGTSTSSVNLRPETTQDGIEDESIQYPDVVSWSPNPEVPRIAFDAFNEVDVGEFGNTIAYWSMYEINFESGSIFNLVPAQSTDISIGNITYSNTNPDLIAFNVFTDTEWDVHIGNFEEGETTAINLPSYRLGGVPITDGRRPTFAPDDKKIAFTSVEHSSVLFYYLETGVLTRIAYSVPFYNARWFLRGGSGGTNNQAPTAHFTASTISGTAPLRVDLNASNSFDPNGDPLSYRWDFDDGSMGGGLTTTHTFSASGTFTVVLTVLDSGGLSDRAQMQIVVAGGVAVEDEGELPKSVILHQNHPNPFNPSTALRFGLPDAMQVDLRVIDMMGRTVSTLVSGVRPAGNHEINFDAGQLPSGIYFARLIAGSDIRTTKMVLLR